MVNKCCLKLTDEELNSFKTCRVSLETLQFDQVNRVKIWGLSLKRIDLHRYRKGPVYEIDKHKNYNEIIIDGKAARINLIPNCLNLRISPSLSPSYFKTGRMLNGNANKSILKKEPDSIGTPSKSVSFNKTYYISPIIPRHNEHKCTPVKNYESMYKEYLQKVQMNGACSGAEQSTASTSQVDSTPMEELEESPPPKRKRGRPKGSGNKKREEMLLQPVVAPMVSSPSPSPPRKRGWPLGVPRKGALAMKGRRGRPRKIIQFGFHSIVSEIKTITLPSDLWSAHVSVTAKRSQVCFTRVVQAVSNTVPVECDRSVKFNGTLKYLVRINNREVELLGAPSAVASLRDVQTLLEIVNDIGINDPVLEYLNR